MSDRQDPEIRRETAYRRLGTRTPQCQGCGARDWRALTGRTPDILCYECRRLAQGRASTEEHHVAGRANASLVASIPANDHRALSDLQEEWPAETLRNPDGSPLLKIAARIRALIDYLRLLLERGVAWIPEALERLDARLRIAIGPNWWDTIEWGFAG